MLQAVQKVIVRQFPEAEDPTARPGLGETATAGDRREYGDLAC
jgi:hypothetical protein